MPKFFPRPGEGQNLSLALFADWPGETRNSGGFLVFHGNLQFSAKAAEPNILRFTPFLKPIGFWICISSNLTQRYIYDISTSPSSVFQYYSGCLNF
jgi:hypothetical protein